MFVAVVRRRTGRTVEVDQNTVELGVTATGHSDGAYLRLSGISLTVALYGGAVE